MSFYKKAYYIGMVFVCVGWAKQALGVREGISRAATELLETAAMRFIECAYAQDRVERFLSQMTNCFLGAPSSSSFSQRSKTYQGEDKISQRFMPATLRHRNGLSIEFPDESNPKA